MKVCQWNCLLQVQKAHGKHHRAMLCGNGMWGNSRSAHQIRRLVYEDITGKELEIKQTLNTQRG